MHGQEKRFFPSRVVDLIRLPQRAVAGRVEMRPLKPSKEREVYCISSQRQTLCVEPRHTMPQDDPIWEN